MAEVFRSSLNRRTRATRSVHCLAVCGWILMWGTLRAAEPFLSLNQVPRAKVVIAQDPDATDAFRPRTMKIQSMMNRAITALTEKASVAEAWRSLVSTHDVGGIKVSSIPAPNTGT